MTNPPAPEDVLPCPFCGSIGELNEFSLLGGRSGFDISCYNGCARLPAVVAAKTKQEAIAAWNTRTPAIADTVCPVCKSPFHDMPVKTQNSDPSLRCNSCGVEFMAVDSQCGITVTPEQYNKLCEMLDAPPKDLPGLRKLLSASAIADGVGVELRVFKETLWEHLQEKLGRTLDAQETFVFHECVNMTATCVLSTPPQAATDEG